MVRRIAIVGLGLIGGSLGLALKQSGMEGTELVGYVRSSEAGDKALRLGVVDRVEQSLASAVSQADIVLLATPTLAIKETLAQIASHLPSGCLVTDTASTKEEVMRWAKEYLPVTVSFVGGHPMAGKELSGLEAAEAGLFRGCTYCLIPGGNTSPASVQGAVNLVREVGANPLFITASEHDNFVAAISHLPLVISSALVRATTQSTSWPKMSSLAATGYRDLTRLASQHPRMNRDICLTNRENIAAWIDVFIQELSHFRRLIADGSEAEIEQAFVEARQARHSWLKDHAKEKD
ncbi:MAG: prephenate dehydrogenase/arogenate dehydrogenase family protein [Chloroflexi bacterium]|nr:prephenate dehydrogenase/arogenate dehydrogenase family protein [Chloroflexota bacterium]